eukprot:scaffold26046_cov158-Skeletonema_marinoi.AAC.5
MIEGKHRHIGVYEDEEEAAVDYARALFNYKGKGAIDKAREQRVQNLFIIDLSDVPKQPPIPKSSGVIKDGASKYTGVSFNKPMKKWLAQIMIAGKSRHIGYYKSEEEAAVDYARAVFKYKGKGALERAMEQRSLDKARVLNSFVVDLSDLPPQSPIPKRRGRIKEGASKNEEEAAIDFARAVLKYKGQGALEKAREQRARRVQNSFVVDLSGVSSQPPILKSAGRFKDRASKCAGIYFRKEAKKWQARISVDGKVRRIGYYEDEVEAAVDYARAVLKYKEQGELDKARGRNSSKGYLELN